jgi:integrase
VTKASTTAVIADGGIVRPSSRSPRRICACGDAITIEDVDRYRRAKVREGELSATSINATIGRLAQILEVAVEYGHATRNVARAKKRKLPQSTPTRPGLKPDHDQVLALLDPAGELDKDEHDDRSLPVRRPLLATPARAGLRIGEACALRWRDVDLCGGTIRVAQAKTDAAVPAVDLQPELRDELAPWHATIRNAGEDDLMFPTRNDTPRDRHNSRKLMLRSLERANERLQGEGQAAAARRGQPARAASQLRVVANHAGREPGPRDGAERAHRPEGDARDPHPRDPQRTPLGALSAQARGALDGHRPRPRARIVQIQTMRSQPHGTIPGTGAPAWRQRRLGPRMRRPLDRHQDARSAARRAASASTSANGSKAGTWLGSESARIISHNNLPALTLPARTITAIWRLSSSAPIGSITVALSRARSTASAHS